MPSKKPAGNTTVGDALANLDALVDTLLSAATHLTGAEYAAQRRTIGAVESPLRYAAIVLRDHQAPLEAALRDAGTGYGQGDED